MSDPLSVGIEYKAAPSTDSIGRVLRAIGDKVNQVRTAMKAAGQYLFPSEINDFPGKSAEELFRELNEPNQYGSTYASISAAPFSPCSAYGLEISFWRRDENQALALHLSMSQRVTYEREGSRERARMEWEWMKKLESHGLVSLEHGWSFELPTENEMPRKEYERWQARYNELEETPSVWDQNRIYLLDIAESLKQALPVTYVSLDERLQLTSEQN